MIWIVCPSTTTVVTGMPEPQAQALVLTAAALAGSFQDRALGAAPTDGNQMIDLGRDLRRQRVHAGAALRRQPAHALGRRQAVAGQDLADQEAGRRLVAVQLGRPRRAALLAAVHRDGGVELGERAIPFAAGQEERQTDGDRLRRAQLLQNLEGRQPGDGPLRQLLARAGDDADFALRKVRHGCRLLASARRSPRQLLAPGRGPGPGRPR